MESKKVKLIGIGVEWYLSGAEKRGKWGYVDQSIQSSVIQDEYILEIQYRAW